MTPVFAPVPPGVHPLNDFAAYCGTARRLPQDLITRYAWGEVWQRPGLDHRTRSFLTLAMLPALGRDDEFRLHLRGALNNGLSRAQIGEVLLHAAVYSGVPAANHGFKLAQEVFGASDAEA